MKKTFAILALAGAFAASANAGVEVTLATNTTDYAGNCNSTIHGFTLNLGSETLNAPVVDLSPTVVLNSFTLKSVGSSKADSGVNVEFALLVLGDFGDNTVLGMSTGTQTTTNAGTLTFSFTDTTGGALTISSASTYRFIAVDGSVLNLISDPTQTYVYNAGGTNSATASTSGGTTTISQGLKAPGIRGHWDENTPTDSAIIASSDIDEVALVPITSNGNTESHYLSPVYDSISVTVPEPATATLSLLALAGLAARRRRK